MSSSFGQAQKLISARFASRDHPGGLRLGVGGQRAPVVECDPALVALLERLDEHVLGGARVGRGLHVLVDVEIDVDVVLLGDVEDEVHVPDDVGRGVLEVGRSADGVGAQIHAPAHQRPEFVVHRVRCGEGQYLEVHDAGEHLLQFQQPLHPGGSPGVVDVGVDPDGSGAVRDRRLQGLATTRHDVGHGTGLLGHIRAGEALGDRSGDRREGSGRSSSTCRDGSASRRSWRMASPPPPSISASPVSAMWGSMRVIVSPTIPMSRASGIPRRRTLRMTRSILHPFAVVRPTLSRTPSPLRRPRVAGS